MEILRGKKQLPPRILIYGSEKIGKSTFAASAPNPIFIDTEDGVGEIGPDRFPVPQTYEDVIAYLRAIYRNGEDYRTVVIDSLDWLERIIWKRVCIDKGKRNIEDFGFAKGYRFAMDYWREVRQALESLRVNKGKIIILVAHAKVEKFDDPRSTSYDKYSPNIHRHAAAMWKEWCDAILFACDKIRVEREDAGFNRIRGVVKTSKNRNRILITGNSPACVAGNRYGLPEEIDLSFDEFWYQLQIARGLVEERNNG